MAEPTLNELVDLINKSDVQISYFKDVITIILSSYELTVNKLIQMSRLPRSIIIKILKPLQIFLLSPSEYIKVTKEGKEVFQKFLNKFKLSDIKKYDWINLEDYTEEIEEIFVFLKDILVKRSPPKRSLDQFNATINTLLRRILFLEREDALSNSKILFLGDYDLTSLAIAKKGGPREIHVVDIDDQLLSLIQNIADEHSFQIKTHHQDLRLGFPSELLSSIDVVFTDPPFTINGARLFLTHAINALTTNGIIYSCFGYSPNDLFIGTQFQELLNKLGLVARTVLENFNVYLKAQSIGSTSHLFKLLPVKYSIKLPIEMIGPIYSGYTEKEDLAQLIGQSIRHKLIQEKVINILLRELLVGSPKSIGFISPTFGPLQNQIKEKGVVIKNIEPNTSEQLIYEKLVIESPCIDLDSIIDWMQIKECKSVYMALPIRFKNIDLISTTVNISLITKILLEIFWKWNLLSEIPPEAYEPRFSQITYLYRVTPILKELLLDLEPSKYILRESLEQGTKKIVNALKESIIIYHKKIGGKMTKKQSMMLVRSLGLPNYLLDLRFGQLSEDELEILIKKLLDEFK
ncbi:MAG: bis-aminopropyl spermidine synthase family protein [Candidatus Helarchaeota archaeon]|nr:bis-aminopropyl spermidine synthase family protein [Candidatus Helarchaeota archaeon]